MAQTIRRNAKPVRRQARAQGARTKVRQAKKQTSSLVDALMRVLPFTEEQLHKAFLVAILAAAAALAWLVASLAGLAGEQDQAMPLFDLAAARASVMELPWVKEARVSRQLPDKIVVDVIEREPHAVLRKPDRLVLIDPSGHELEPISQADAEGMLLISGPGAQAQVEALTALLDAAPALRPQVTAAEWVGNRRWNLTFKSGQVLALPQGDPESAAALMEFARADGLYQLIGGKALAFDMRVEGRFYIRCPAGLECGPAAQGGEES